MLSNLMLRSAWEQLQRKAGLTTEQPDPAPNTQATPHNPCPNWDIVDATWLPTPFLGRRRKWADVPFVVVHVTDVRGGFGVERKDIARWKRILAKTPDVVPEDLRDHPELAEFLALLERYRKSVEYHRLVTHEDILVHLHDFGIRTPHAGNKVNPGGNDGLGFALDQAADEECPQSRALAARELLTDTAEELFDARATEIEPPYDYEETPEVVDPIPVIAHRCVSPPHRRGNDPGKIVWREVVIPAVQARPDLLRIDYEHATYGGLPIPTVWDENAHFDIKGKRVRTA